MCTARWTRASALATPSLTPHENPAKTCVRPYQTPCQRTIKTLSTPFQYLIFTLLSPYRHTTNLRTKSTNLLLQPSWGALIRAYGDSGEWTRALAAFEAMRKAGITPDTAHWTAVIRAVGSRKAWQRTEFGRVRAMQGLVQALYGQMKEAGCAPNEVRCSLIGFGSERQGYGIVGAVCESAIDVDVEADLGCVRTNDGPRVCHIQ